jgi:hypothetical protein
MVDRYAQQAAELAEELAASLSEREVQMLRDYFGAAKLADWLSWHDAHREDVPAFVRSTPAARRKRANWREDIPLLTYAAYLHCIQAYAMLLAVAKYDLRPGGSYRDMADRAGAAFQAAQDADADFESWPWEGPDPTRQIYGLGPDVGD